MRLLVTNDDGIFSPGLAALARAARRMGEVRVVSPDVEQSSAGHAITSSRPLSWRPTTIGAVEGHRVNGTPADCVALGLSNWENVDAVLSGINLGPNLGNGMWHSGTLAAAKQAALLGVRGVALSSTSVSEETDFEMIAPWVDRVLHILLTRAPELKLVNVNFPSAPVGIAWTRQAVRHYDGYVVPGRDPLGRPNFWFTVRPIEEVEEGTDLWAVRHNLVSMTPLQLDLTDHDALSGAMERHPLPVGAVPEGETEDVSETTN